MSAALVMAWLSGMSRRAYPIAAVTLAVIVAAFTVRPDWGRRPFSSHFLAADWPALPAGSMIVTSSGSSLAFFALGLPGDIPMVAIHNNMLHPQRCRGLQHQVEMRIRGHSGRFWLLEEDRQHAELQHGRQLARDSYGLVVEGTCQPIRTSFGQMRLCPMVRQEAAVVCPVGEPTS